MTLGTLVTRGLGSASNLLVTGGLGWPAPVVVPVLTITEPDTPSLVYYPNETLTVQWTSDVAMASRGQWGVWLRSGLNEWGCYESQNAGAGTTHSQVLTFDRSYGSGCNAIVAWRASAYGEWLAWATSPVTFTVGLDSARMPTYRPELLSVGVGPLVGSTPAEANPTLDITALIEGLAWDRTSRGGLGGASGYVRQPAAAGIRSARTSTNLCPDPLGTALTWWAP